MVFSEMVIFLRQLAPVLIASGVALFINHQYQKKKDRREILSKIFDDISDFFVNLYNYMFTLPQKEEFDEDLSKLKLKVNTSGFKLNASLFAYLTIDQNNLLSPIQEKMTVLMNEIVTLKPPIKFDKDFVIDKTSRIATIRNELILKIKSFKIT